MVASVNARRSALIGAILLALFVLYVVTRPMPVILIGDSMTSRWDVSALSQQLGIPAISKGVAGETSEQTLYRVLNDQQPARAYVVVVGVNDLDWDVSDTALRDNVAVIVAALRQHTRTVYVGSILPVGERYARLRPRIEANNAWLEAFAATHPNVIFVDFYTAFGGQESEQYFADGLHPNAAGYALMGETLRCAFSEAE